MDAHQRFNFITKRLQHSHVAVRRTAVWLTERGHKIEIAVQSLAPRPEQWRRYVDGGDLFMDGGRRVEVKHLSRQFTGKHDWPFTPHFIVNAKATHDSCERKPYCYVVWSRDLDCAAVVFAISEPFWTVERRHDNKLERDAEFYFCPMQYVGFYAVPAPNTSNIFADNEFGF